MLLYGGWSFQRRSSFEGGRGSRVICAGTYNRRRTWFLSFLLLWCAPGSHCSAHKHEMSISTETRLGEEFSFSDDKEGQITTLLTYDHSILQIPHLTIGLIISCRRFFPPFASRRDIGRYVRQARRAVNRWSYRWNCRWCCRRCCRAMRNSCVDSW